MYTRYPLPSIKSVRVSKKKWLKLTDVVILTLISNQEAFSIRNKSGSLCSRPGLISGEAQSQFGIADRQWMDGHYSNVI